MSRTLDRLPCPPAGYGRAELTDDGGDVMGRVGRLLMLFGFLILWPLPVVGSLVMVAGAISTAIDSEVHLGASRAAGGATEIDSSAIRPV